MLLVGKLQQTSMLFKMLKVLMIVKQQWVLLCGCSGGATCNLGMLTNTPSLKNSDILSAKF